ncbi:MAG: ATP-binding protein [Archangium sp.]|nr:ATP-binding protein [Archangium sp.]
MTTLKILFVEDVEDDAQLVLQQLKRGGLATTSTRVETEEAMDDALLAERWDLVICDYSLPRFSALGALATLQRRGLDIPFIIVSGTVGEETAAAAMKAGAHDYLMKDKLVRLVGVVERECRDARGRAEQREADHAAKESAKLYRSLVDTLPDGVGVVGLHGRFLLCNERLTSMHGHATGALVGQSQLQLFAAEDHARAEEAFGQLRSTGGVRNFELSMARQDGSRFPAELSATAILGEDRNPEAFIVVVRDITERKELQARLILGDRMASIGTLAAGVAHEINNPLAYILGNLASAMRQVTEHNAAGAAWLATGPANVPAALRLTLDQLDDCRDALGEAIEGAERVRDIVRDLKTVSRSDEADRGPVDLERVVEAAIRMASHEIRHRARLVKHFAHAPVVRGSDGRLTQVFLNLLVNAAQAIPEGAALLNEVTVTIRTDARGRAVVDVNDTGQGIPPEACARVFDPFFTTKPVGVGTGLGLSLCRGIVSSLGGELTFESEVGKGTAFHVTLPPSLAVA